MAPLLSVLWLLLAFGLFMALIWSVHAVNRVAVRRYGYEPFSLPNAALMLVANLLLLSALAPGGDGGSASADAGLRSQVMLGAVAVLAAGLLVVIARRTSLRLGLYAVALMTVGAIAVFPSLVFMRFAAAAGGGADTTGEPPADRDTDARPGQSAGGADESAR